MKTINKLLLPLLLTVTTLSAIDKSYSFIGIQTGYANVHDKSMQSIGVKYGQQTKEYRTSFSYNYASKSNLTNQSLLLEVDRGIFKKDFKDLPFKPYAGIALGVMEERNKGGAPSKDRGYLYGLSTGIAYIANDHLDFDLSYRYLRTHQMENIDEINNINLALHYFY